MEEIAGGTNPRGGVNCLEHSYIGAYLATVHFLFTWDIDKSIYLACNDLP